MLDGLRLHVRRQRREDRAIERAMAGIDSQIQALERALDERNERVRLVVDQLMTVARGPHKPE
jgi:hypothetical protein